MDVARLYSRNKQECIKRYKNKSVVSDDRIITRFKAFLSGYDVSRHILSSVDIKAVNEAI